MRSKKCPKCGRTTLNKTCEYCGAPLPDIHTALSDLFDIQSLKNDFKQSLKSIFTTYAIVAVILWTMVCLYNLSQISEVGLLGYLAVSLFGYAFCIAIADIIYYSILKKKPKQPNTHVVTGYTQEPDEELRVVNTKYFDGVQKIQSMWSVLYNLNGFSGEHADIFETTCYENLADLQSMLRTNQKYGYDSKMPSHVPAYVRLAMLYEKQKNYQEAINICVEAIKKGAVLDGNQGQMHGRLARLIRKSGISVNEDILQLIDSAK